MKNVRLIMLGMAFLAAAMVFPDTALGQEMIVEIPYPHEHSIVRHIDDQSALIYNNSLKGNHFFRIDVNTPSVVTYKALSNSNLKILDFEIFVSVVYFCGETDTIKPQAMFGYFHIANFPTGDIYIDSVPTLRRFKKLEVFSIAGNIHVAMTATGLKGIDAVVDVRDVASNVWQYDIVNAPDKTYTFDDVAVTDTIVVYSGRLLEEPSPYIPIFWYFPKPHYPGITLFFNTSGIHRIQLNNGSPSLTHLTSLYGNKFESASDKGYTQWELDGLDGMMYFGSILAHKDSSGSVSDICPINIRMRSHVSITSPARTDIMEGTSFTMVPTTNPYKFANAEIIKSMDVFPPARRVVGVGNTSADPTLRFYLMDYINSEDCVPILSRLYSHTERNDVLTKTDVEIETILHDFRIMEYGIGDSSTKKICGNK